MCILWHILVVFHFRVSHRAKAAAPLLGGKITKVLNLRTGFLRGLVFKSTLAYPAGSSQPAGIAPWDFKLSGERVGARLFDCGRGARH